MPQLDTRGFTLAYDVIGETSTTPPIVWGHGLTGSRGIEAAFPFVELGSLARRHQIVRYDARGHGMSSVLADPAMGGWLELARDQIALVEHLSIERFILGGVSMGAGTALHTAVMLGDRVDRMVLVIPPTGWEERAAQTELYAKSAHAVEERGTRDLIRAAALLPPPDPFAGSTEYQDRRAGALGGADPARLAACFRGAAFADLPAPDALRAVATPTLVLAWSGDAGHPVSTAERLGELLPNVEVVVSSTRDEFAQWTQRTEAFLQSS